MEAVIALVIGIVAVLLVPALVWATVIAGLIQILRGKVQENLAAVTRRAAASTK